MATSRVTTTGALSGGNDLAAAAGIIARRARELAGTWSASIPATMTLEVSGRVATITAGGIDPDHNPAYPAELRKRHPLFGNREFWYGPPGPPFLGPAADEMADAAMARYAQKIDRLARQAGFE